MATVTETILIDDIDGTEGAETLVFGLDGATYEIDLAPANMTMVREALGPLVEKATRVDGKRKPRKTGSAKQSDASKIREWAAANGHQVGARGRIPSEVIEAYQAAQS